VITPKINDFGDWQSLDGKKVSLDNDNYFRFGGSNLIENRGNLSILMKKYTNAIIPLKIFSLLCCTLGTEDDKKHFGRFRRIYRCFSMALLFATPQEINILRPIKMVGKLDSHSGMNVYIVNKARNLRGRKRLRNIRKVIILSILLS
jgi:hypothetical protein